MVRVRNWLLNAPIQVENGDHCGGICGWLDKSDQMAFVYGEITGYYLVCLAYMEKISGRNPDINRKMKSAAGWICRLNCCPAPPLTRFHFKQKHPDWRNRFVFSFDLAMMLRGLSMAKPGCADEYKAGTSAIVNRLEQFIDKNGRLMPVIPINNASAIPERWSTMTGAYQVKAAAAILTSQYAEKSKPLINAALNTVDYYRKGNRLPNHPHPYLYFLEGLLIYAGHCNDSDAIKVVIQKSAPILASRFERCAVRSGVNHPFAITRSDVIAQIVRVGSVLISLGFDTAHGIERQVEKHHGDLAEFVGSDGAVYFSPKTAAHRRYRNTWSAMFAFQAFSFYNQLKKKKDKPEMWLEYLI